MKLKTLTFLTLAALALTLGVSCKTPTLEPGGAYSPASTNAAGQVVLTAQPDTALFVADAAYKLAYDTVFAVLKFERDNRAALLKISPTIKSALDQARPEVVAIDRRWALARQAYKLNPTPAGLNTIQLIIADIQRLIPVVQAELAPAYATADRPAYSNPNLNPK